MTITFDASRGHANLDAIGSKTTYEANDKIQSSLTTLKSVKTAIVSLAQQAQNLIPRLSEIQNNYGMNTIFYKPEGGNSVEYSIATLIDNLNQGINGIEQLKPEIEAQVNLHNTTQSKITENYHKPSDNVALYRSLQSGLKKQAEGLEISSGRLQTNFQQLQTNLQAIIEEDATLLAFGIPMIK